MNNPVRWFLERISERIVPLVGESLAGTLATMLSLGRAEQQNELEEAARRYEADGKPQIAQALRQQAARLATLDPAAEAKRIQANLALDQDQPLPAIEDQRANAPGRVPDFASAPAGPRRKKPQESVEVSETIPTSESGAE